MRNVVLYIATSLDGFIAGTNDEIDWLFQDDDYGFTPFINSVDTLIIGNNTYKTMLALGDYPHNDKQTYVLTRQNEGMDSQSVQFIRGNYVSFFTKLKRNSGKDIWLVGGGEVNRLFLENRLIDRMIISIHPVIIGSGIPLFKISDYMKFDLEMTAHRSFPSGLVQIEYNVIYK